MTPQELVEIIKLHERFVNGRQDGARANLQYQDLSGLRLPGLNLSHSVASGANFSDCQMMGTDFSHADLFAADFRNADLTEVNFDRADLRGARFRGATIIDSTFREADLRPGSILSLREGSDSTDLSDTALDGARFDPGFLT